MNKIESFKINHDVLQRGIYVSRIDGDVVTLDIRVKKPNGGDYLKTDAMHTIEHIFATYVRNSEYSESVIYFGPMGCRTGFYLLMRDDVSKEDVISLIKSAFLFIADFEGEIPGNSKVECGNYLEHDLAGAKAEAALMAEVLNGWKPSDMKYKEV
ncbi:MAG: S-ribosylhomocysteine lyase [Ruminococcaceae bacterium]|nr:S-ribosylhomocysteine lyase [Oscillospiraceae bacterium]